MNALTTPILFSITVPVNTLAIKGSLRATFKAMRVSESKEIEMRCQEDKSGSAGFVRAVAVGVDQVSLNVPIKGLNLDGSFDSQADGLAELLDWPGIPLAMQRRYYDGLWEEAEKNSEKPAHG